MTRLDIIISNILILIMDEEGQVIFFSVLPGKCRMTFQTRPGPVPLRVFISTFTVHLSFGLILSELLKKSLN
jgi:hypothetical protein